MSPAFFIVVDVESIESCPVYPIPQQGDGDANGGSKTLIFTELGDFSPFGDESVQLLNPDKNLGVILHPKLTFTVIQKQWIVSDILAQ